MAGKYWVTWKDEADSTAARKSALIWGPQATAPAQLSGWFEGGPFATKADAERYKNAIGTGSIIPPPGTPIIGGGVHLPNPLSGVNAIGDFFNKLGQANTWIRVAEVVLGIALIGIGIAHATGTDNAISRAVKTTAKVAVLK